MKKMIFDIGNVLLSFHPDEFLSQFYDEETMGDLMTIIFSSDEWIELDLGNMTIDEVIDIFAKRNPQYKQEIHFVLKNWTQMMQPIAENIEIIYELKEKGYPLYILSNFHDEAIQEMLQKYDFFQLFDGMVISAYEHRIKPDQQFFQTLINRFHLIPEECLFIDDMAANIRAANELGIQGIHLHYKTNLKEELIKLHIL